MEPTDPARLVVFSGLPGTGKSTLARGLARRLGATLVRIDSVEAALLNAGHGRVTVEGYAVAYALAADNLQLGRSVVADCVNSVRETREAWVTVAGRAGVPLSNVEIVCSDPSEHRRRVSARHADAANHAGRWSPPTWNGLPGYGEGYQPWEEPVLRVDTARRTQGEHLDSLVRALFRDGGRG